MDASTPQPSRIDQVDEVMKTPPWLRTPEQVALGATITVAESIEVIARDAERVRAAQS